MILSKIYKLILFGFVLVAIPLVMYNCEPCGKGFARNAQVINMFLTGVDSIQNQVDTITSNDSNSYFVLNLDIATYAQQSNNPFALYACSPASAQLQNGQDSVLIVCTDDYNSQFMAGQVLNDSTNINNYAYRTTNITIGNRNMPVLLNQLVANEIFSSSIQSIALFIKPKPIKRARVRVVLKRFSTIILQSSDIFVKP